MKPVLRQAANLRRAQEGTTAIEFALVAAPFFFLVGCILEIGIMSFTEYTLQNAVEEAGRTIRIGGATTMTGSDFRTEICSKAVTISNCDTRLGLAVVSAGTFTGLSVPAIKSVRFSASPSFTPGNGGQAVAVIATYDWQFVFPFLRPLSNLPGVNARLLHGIAVFRNEPF